jgi:hypothetical protein
MRLVVSLFLTWVSPAVWAAPAASPIFPIPREASFTQAAFTVSEDVVIALPESAGASDRQLARLLMSEFSDRFGVAVYVQSFRTLPRGKRIVVAGSMTNPLVRAAVAGRKLPGAEGYVLDVGPDLVLVAGSDEAGAFYGVQSLRQLLSRDGSAVRIAGAQVRDWPYKPFRGIKLYLPGRDNLPYFRRFVRDFMALHKYNRLILELNAAMRLDRHPELNAGWLDFGRHLNATRRDRPAGPHGESTDSSHQDTADGGILEKDEIREIVRYAAENHIEVIPELPSLTHSYYLLTRHRELAEIPDAEWPDTFCPSLPASYELLFDVLDEYLEVMKPRMVHVGKDEWRMPWGVCPRCRNRDYRELFVADVRKTYDHLKKRGVEVAMWGDHLIEPLRGAGLSPRKSPTGYQYSAPGAITVEQAKSLPKDILMFNWFWDEQHASTGQGEKTDLTLEEWGFRQIYGNMTPGVQNYGRRSARKSVIGGAPSSWAATTEFNFGKDLLGAFLGCANMLWSTVWPDPAELSTAVQRRVEFVRPLLGGVSLPSEFDPVTAVRMTGGSGEVIAPGLMRTGAVRSGRYAFDVQAPAEVGVSVAVGEDVSSLVFLHAAAKPAGNLQAYRYIYNFDDSADLLGWYEVEYEDGFVVTVPVRYRVNILEWSRAVGYCYRANAIELGTSAEKPVTFYAFEWTNPRLGKVVKEVRLKGTDGFRQGTRKIPPNAILLAGVSIVRKRPVDAARAGSNGKR